jgi:hypothetical protein
VYDAARTDELDTLRAQLARVAEEREHHHKLYLEALERMRKLELGLLGQKAERLPEPEAQLTLALLAQLLGRPASGAPAPAPAPAGTQTIREHTRKKPTGRKPSSRPPTGKRPASRTTLSSGSPRTSSAAPPSSTGRSCIPELSSTAAARVHDAVRRTDTMANYTEFGT